MIHFFEIVGGVALATVGLVVVSVVIGIVFAYAIAKLIFD